MGKRLIAVLATLCIGSAAACGDDDSSQGEQDQATGDSTADGMTDSDASGSTGGPPASSEVDPDGVLRMGYDLVAAATGGFTFDPAAGINPTTTHLGIYHWLYGALMRPTPDGTLEPGVAEEATIVDDQTIELVIRDGLMLPDGTAFGAEAIKAALERNLSLDPEESGFEPAFFAVESIELTAPNTLQLHIPNGTAASWHDVYLGKEGTVIVPEDTNFDQPDGLGGLGPFTVAEFVPEERLVLEKNSEYWNADEIEVGRIELVNTPSATRAGVNALRAGQIDWTYLDYSLLDAVGNEFETTIEASDEQLTYFSICKSEAPFDDPRVRQALSYAIDREAINQAIFDGTGEVASDLFLQSHRFHNDELEGHYAYDPERARQLLADAGLADGFTFDMIPIQAGNVPQIAQIVQQQWRDIGVTMNIAAEPDFVQAFWIDKRAPMGAIPTIAPEPRGRLDPYNGDELVNTCGYHDPELAELSEQLDTISNSSDEAIRVWADIQGIIVEDALSVFVVFQPEVHAFDGDQLGGVVAAPYLIPVPDIWELYVKA